MEKYGLVAENMESTIVAKYDSDKAKESKYQSEAELENSFIKHVSLVDRTFRQMGFRGQV